MPKQTVPDISFSKFVFAEIPRLFASNKIKINSEYQRGDIWKLRQKVELIKSIENRYSIGVLVLFINDDEQFEILDGQQRLLTINQYLDNKLPLSGTDLPYYKELDFAEKTLLDAYCIFYLKLKSHDPESKEEDIVQTFLRLQEGTPLNKAEKINAYRGKFKDTFKETRETHRFFTYLGTEKRFRWRQLAAEMLLIELESDFDRMVLTNIDLPALQAASTKYEKTIPSNRVKAFKGNLDFLDRSLNIILTAFTPREAIAFYLLISYLRKKKAGNIDLENEFAEFGKDFLKNLNSFSMYDEKPPSGMSKTLFSTYRRFKEQSKVLTTSDSLRTRLEIMVEEFNRMHPMIIKDKKRLHDAEQKRIMYFRQKGICSECKNDMKFSLTSAHHVIAHSAGGNTDDLDHAILLHERCHAKLEKRLLKHAELVNSVTTLF
ncbi:MAG: DUF262 domain-containing protein [Bacteroidetes bacterium]|nr:MAG: DUF262 domain-containing protein [Bacteroidota bacterium]